IKALFICWASSRAVASGPVAHGKWAFSVDNSRGQSLYKDQRRAVRLRRDCAPLKLLTGTVNWHPTVDRMHELLRLFGSPEGGGRHGPRAVCHVNTEKEKGGRRNPCGPLSSEEAIFHRDGFGRDIGGLTFQKVHH